MSNIKLDNLDDGNAHLSLEQIDGIPHVFFKGEVDMRDPSLQILPYLMTIHDLMLENNIPEINVDFKELLFMNSSGLKVLINWIMKLKDIEQSGRYIINFIYDSKITWQTSSFPILKRLLSDAINLQAV